MLGELGLHTLVGEGQLYGLVLGERGIIELAGVGEDIQALDLARVVGHGQVRDGILGRSLSEDDPPGVCGVLS